MSRRVSRVGTADKPPTVEETLARLEVKMKEMELKMELQEIVPDFFREMYFQLLKKYILKCK